MIELIRKAIRTQARYAWRVAAARMPRTAREDWLPGYARLAIFVETWVSVDPIYREDLVTRAVVMDDTIPKLIRRAGGVHNTLTLVYGDRKLDPELWGTHEHPEPTITDAANTLIQIASFRGVRL